MANYYSEYLARFRALSMFYQQCHWHCKGAFFYQDHLLFERLYNDVNDAIDGIAEKGIAASGSSDFVLLDSHLKEVTDISDDYELPDDVLNTDMFSLAAKQESALEEFLNKEFKLEKNIGAQNMIQGHLEEGLQRQYLLNQRIASAAPVTSNK